MEGALLALLVVITIVIMVAVAVLVFVFAKQRSKQPVGGICVSTSDCAPGLLCENGTCRSTSGGTCNGNNECSTGLSCENGVCHVDSGGSCLSDTQCTPGLVCINGKCVGPELPADTGTQVEVDEVPTFRFPSSRVTDVAQVSGETVFFMGPYAHKIVDGGVEEIPMDRDIERVAWSGDNLVGLSSGKLYLLDLGSVGDSTWRWIPAGWGSSNIYYITNTGDRRCLWVQSLSGPNSFGSLYAYDGNTTKLVKQTQLPEGQIRIYGEDEHSYIDVDQTTKVGTIYEEDKQVGTIPDMVSGVINGKTIKVLPSERSTSLLRMVDGKVYEIYPY